MAQTGLLATAFLVSYMLLAPVFGQLADRLSRWTLIGASVAIWTLASGASGLAISFGVLLATRIFVGIGEAGYGPAAPTIIADLYPVERRGRMLAYFYVAIPVGSALGYVLGGAIDASFGWRSAFYAVVPPGLILAALCFFMRDPRKRQSEEARPELDPVADARRLLSIPSYALNTAAMTAMTFAIGGMAFWIPSYIFEHRRAEFTPSPNLLGQINTTFGAISAVGGLLATLLGGWAGDRLRKRYPSSYFLVSGTAMLLAFPATIGMLKFPFPWAWICVFLAIFFLFFNTGPSNTALANVSPPAIRATAFALNILCIHLLGDALSPPLIGWIAGKYNMDDAFIVVSLMMLVAGVLWLVGAKHLPRDTEEAAKADPVNLPTVAE